MNLPPIVINLPPALTLPLAGTFLYGKTKEPRETAPFQAGVYPVTNAQFAQFVLEGGYAVSQWWNEAGWQWQQGLPSYGGQKGWPDFWEDSEFNSWPQPVVGVTWYEAEAFCRWLTAIYGREYRLPTELEWERLARGQDGREYPWGNEWQEGLANTSESGPQRTSAVGSFPAGVSPTGAHDCAGNVWEWCADGFDEGQKHRVLRGGSWLGNQDSARCAVRDWVYPDFSYYFIGFRVVVSPGRDEE